MGWILSLGRPGRAGLKGAALACEERARSPVAAFWGAEGVKQHPGNKKARQGHWRAFKGNPWTFYVSVTPSLTAAPYTSFGNSMVCQRTTSWYANTTRQDLSQ
jgi:hypothetical protein